jgi:PilZ domain
MFKQRRDAQRSAFSRHGRIQFEGTNSTRDCLITNMSENGVRLHLEIAELPADFTLLLTDAAWPRRSCRVVWQLGFEFGAKFTDSVRAAVRRPAMPASAA